MDLNILACIIVHYSIRLITSRDNGLTPFPAEPLSITKAIRMENLEQYWEQSFSPLGRKFAEIRSNYQDMGETDSIFAALYWL